MPLTPEQIPDFINLTLPTIKRDVFTDLSMELTEYVFADLFANHKVEERGGQYINFKVKTKNTGNAKNTGMFAADNTRIEDVSIDANVPWTMQTTSWAYDIYEDLFQSDRETIVRELVMREHDAMSDLVELQEENLWSAPSSTADKRPMGIPFWLQKDATTTPGGAFNGGNPSGFTAGCAGISSATYPRWKNWTFGYTNVSVDDLIVKLKKACWNTKFKAPVPHPEFGYGKASWMLYTTYRVQEPLERLCESRNDNLGNDLAKYQNSVLVGSKPMKAVPYLETNDTSDPIYGINWRVFRPFVKKGANMRRHGVKEAARQHTVREVHIDHWMNYICTNRRMLFVGSKS